MGGSGTPGNGILRFGVFELDLVDQQLRKAGVLVRLQPQPCKVLALLASRSGKVVNREELRHELWGEQTFVDFEQGLNYCIRQIRAVLGDEAQTPRYIETIPRRGYRFLAPVEMSGGPEAAAGTIVSENGDASSPETAARGRTQEGRMWRRVGAVLAGLALCAATVAVWLLRSQPAMPFHSRDSLLVADFENQTGDPRLDQALQTAFTISLEQSRFATIFPRTRVGSVLRRMEQKEDARITPALAVEICQREGIRGALLPGISRAGNQFILTAQLIDPGTGGNVKSYEERAGDENHLLSALDRIAADVRHDLGESLYQIHQADRPLAQVTTPSIEALKDYSTGQQLWHSGKYDQAVSSYKAALAADPDFVMANEALGHSLYTFVYFQAAEGDKYYQKAMQLSSRVTERERRIIELDYAEDRDHVAETLALYERYLEQYPDDWDQRFGYARLLRIHGHPAEGIEQDKRILQGAPDYARAYIDMASAYNELGQFQQSLAAYDGAFRLEPRWRNIGNINREYGFALIQNGQADDAEQLFSELLADAAWRKSALRSLAFLDLYRGKYRSAEKRLEEVLNLDLTSKATFDAARTRYELAVVAAGEGRKHEQVAQLDAILAGLGQIGEKVQYGALLGQAYARVGETAKARNVLNQIAPLADGRSQEQTEYLSILQAEVAAADGNTKQAIELLAAPAANDQSSLRLLAEEELAHVYQQAGALDQAVVWYEKFLKTPWGWSGWEPQQEWFEDHCILAEDYRRKGRTAEAIKTIDALLDLWKGADAGLVMKQKALQLRASLLPHS